MDRYNVHKAMTYLTNLEVEVAIVRTTQVCAHLTNVSKHLQHFLDVYASTPISWLAGVTLSWHMLNPTSKGCIFVTFGIDTTVC